MKIRVKFGSRRLPIDVTPSDGRMTVSDIIRCASDAFGLAKYALPNYPMLAFHPPEQVVRVAVTTSGSL